MIILKLVLTYNICFPEISVIWDSGENAEMKGPTAGEQGQNIFVFMNEHVKFKIINKYVGYYCKILLQK